MTGGGDFIDQLYQAHSSIGIWLKTHADQICIVAAYSNSGVYTISIWCELSLPERLKSCVRIFLLMLCAIMFIVAQPRY